MRNSQVYIHSIKTEYKKYIFRSRLEAKWASFFDLIKWPWQYEPIDLNGYIPDFIITFKTPLLVEVKPEFSKFDLESHTKKIEESGWDKEAIIVGAALLDSGFWPGRYCIGIIGNPPDENFCQWQWTEAALFWCINCTSISVLSSELSWRCRRNDCYDGDGYVDMINDEWLQNLWADATNRTQYEVKTDRYSNV